MTKNYAKCNFQLSRQGKHVTLVTSFFFFFFFRVKFESIGAKSHVRPYNSVDASLLFGKQMHDLDRCTDLPRCPPLAYLEQSPGLTSKPEFTVSFIAICTGELWISCLHLLVLPSGLFVTVWLQSGNIRACIYQSVFDSKGLSTQSFLVKA